MPNTKILPSNIDLEKLSSVLEDNYSFSRGGKDDVSYVDGVSSNMIAKASTRTIDGTEVLIGDRNLVDKALFLYNAEDDSTISATDIVKTTDLTSSIASQLNGSQMVINNHISDELLSIRNELYHLMSSLSKKGILNNYYADNGFFDPFDVTEKRYGIEYICDIAQTGTISAGFTQHIYVHKDNLSQIHPGFWYIVEKEFSQSEVLNEIIYVSSVQVGEADLIDCTVYDFTKSDVGLNLKDSSDLYTTLPTMKLKSFHGQYVNNSFSFSKSDKYVETGSKNEISFDDDSFIITAPVVDSNNPAFAFSCRIPANKVGTLKTFTVYGAPTGNASDLQCYLLKDSDRINNQESIVNRFISGDETVLAKSRQVFVSTLNGDAAWNNAYKVTFDFSDEADGKYKAALENDTYLFVIVPTNPEATGSWDFTFSRNPSSGNDVQTNNKCYTYAYDASVGYTFIIKEYNYDLMYSIITETVLSEKEIGFTNGLYTSEPFMLHNNASDIQLSMVVNREGYLRVANTATVNGSNNDPIVIELDNNVKSLNSNLVGYNYGLKAGDTIVIGDQILTIKKENSDNRIFINEDNVTVNSGDIVYKIGYKVNMLLYRKDSVGEDIIDNYEFTLNDIIQNSERNIDNTSDQLIFKAKDIINNKPTFDNISSFDKLYYKGIISIAWRSDAPSLYFEEGEYSNSNFIGRIYSLVISTSRVNDVK